MSVSLRVLLGASAALGALTTDMYQSALPRLQQYFLSSVFAIQTTVFVVPFAIVVGMLCTSSIAVRFGKKQALLGAICLYSLASVGCMVSPSMELFLSFRIVQGIASGMAVVMSYALLTDICTPEELPSTTATVTGCMALVPMIAPIAGSQLLRWFDWQSHFMVMACYGALLLWLLWRVVPERTRLQSTAFSSFRVQYGACIRNRRYLCSAIVGGLSFSVMFLYITQNAFLFMTYYGLSVVVHGFVFAGVVSGFVIGSFCSSRLCRSASIIVVVRRATYCMVVIGICTMLLAWYAQLSYALFILMSFCMFFANGCIHASVQSTAVRMMPGQTVVATALFFILRLSIAGVCAGIASFLFNGTPTTIATAYAVLPLSVVCVLFFYRKRYGIET